MSFRVKIQSIHLLLSASKNWRSEFDVKLRVDRWGHWSENSSSKTFGDDQGRTHAAVFGFENVISLEGEIIGICMPK